jgi:hypothetical protein
MLSEALQHFEDAINTCKNMQKDENFTSTGGCKLCRTNVADSGHPKSQRHLKGIICMKLLKKMEDISNESGHRNLGYKTGGNLLFVDNSRKHCE